MAKNGASDLNIFTNFKNRHEGLKAHVIFVTALITFGRSTTDLCMSNALKLSLQKRMNKRRRTDVLLLHSLA